MKISQSLKIHALDFQKQPINGKTLDNRTKNITANPVTLEWLDYVLDKLKTIFTQSNFRFKIAEEHLFIPTCFTA